jgi:hypothetical protein
MTSTNNFIENLNTADKLFHDEKYDEAIDILKKMKNSNSRQIQAFKNQNDIINKAIKSYKNIKSDNTCDCCVKSWTDIPNEFGICECLCRCGDDLKNCRHECY